jgi:MFS family permease
MFTCFVYDLALFMIFSVNIINHQDDGFATTELSLLGSCVLFGFLFEIVGRKRIFTMRLIVTSIASLAVPFIKKIPWDLIQLIPAQSLALVMCSVSLTVPVVSDFVKYRRRGLAYGYTGCLLAFSLIILLTILDFDVEKKIDPQWFFVATSTFGLVSALSLCWFFTDKRKFEFKI